MASRIELTDRRRIIQGIAFGAAAFATPGLFAEQLVVTPPVGEGPFYPDKLPLDTDNDLIIINNAITPAVGEGGLLGMILVLLMGGALVLGRRRQHAVA